MPADLLITQMDTNYTAFFIFQATFILFGIGFTILLKFLFKKLMSALVANNN